MPPRFHDPAVDTHVHVSAAGTVPDAALSTAALADLVHGPDNGWQPILEVRQLANRPRCLEYRLKDLDGNVMDRGNLTVGDFLKYTWKVTE